MKRIVANFANEKYLSRVEEFCREEQFVLTPVNSPQDVGHDPLMFIITDNKAEFPRFSAFGPVCLISNDKPVFCGFSLKESFGVIHLRMLIDRVYHGCSLGNYSPSLIPSVFHKEYLLANDYYNIDRIVYVITSELVFLFTFSDLEKLRVGISEMITNAIEHGNLGITGLEKMESTENGTYYNLLNDRLKDPAVMKKKTRVVLDFKDGILSISIEDEGCGFDTSKIPDPTDTERLLKLHGRGIFITKMYFNDIKYNKKGNRVTLIKRIR